VTYLFVVFDGSNKLNVNTAAWKTLSNWVLSVIYVPPFFTKYFTLSFKVTHYCTCELPKYHAFLQVNCKWHAVVTP